MLKAMAECMPDGTVVMVVTEPVFYIPSMVGDNYNLLNSFTVPSRFISDPNEVCGDRLALPSLGDSVDLLVQARYRVSTRVCCVVRLIGGELFVTSTSDDTPRKWSIATLFDDQNIAAASSHRISRRRIIQHHPKPIHAEAVVITNDIDDVLMNDAGDMDVSRTTTTTDELSSQMLDKLWELLK